MWEQEPPGITRDKQANKGDGGREFLLMRKWAVGVRTEKET